MSLFQPVHRNLPTIDYLYVCTKRKNYQYYCDYLCKHFSVQHKLIEGSWTRLRGVNCWFSRSYLTNGYRKHPGDRARCWRVNGLQNGGRRQRQEVPDLVNFGGVPAKSGDTTEEEQL